MARGKYAEKAAKRKAELDAGNDLATYQHRVAKLTAENRELRERMAAQERAARQVERRLRAERDEGIAPQTEALRMQLTAEKRKHREQVQAIAKALADAVERDANLRFSNKTRAELAKATGMTLGDLFGHGPREYRRARPVQAEALANLPVREQEALISEAERLVHGKGWQHAHCDHTECDHTE